MSDDEVASAPTASALADAALRSAVDAAPDGILIVDERGTIVFVNPMVEQLFGYERDELIDAPVEQLVPESIHGAHAAYRERYVEHPRSRVMGSGLDLHGRHRSGSEFPVEISLSPVRSSGRMLVIAIVRDIADRLEADTELERARANLALGEERERIARDLHDTVIQRLFAVGLSLQAALTRSAPGPTADRMNQAIDDIDATIRDLRSAIFALHTRRPGGAAVRDDVIAISREAARGLGFEPAIVFAGPVDSAATGAIRDHLVASLREALSNVAKHAQASRVDVEIVLDGRELVLIVRDDGVGIAGDHPAGNGMGNLRERAEQLGGRFEAFSPASGGTTFEWRVPIGDPGS